LKENLYDLNISEMQQSPQQLEPEQQTSTTSSIQHQNGNGRKPLSILPGTSAAFGPMHRKALNFVFENVANVDGMLEPYKYENKYDECLLLGNMSRFDLKLVDESIDVMDKLKHDEKTLALLLNKVIQHDPLKISIRESFTNNFVNYLLNKVGFNSFPLVLNAQPKYWFEVENNKVSTRPEFSVEKEDQIKCIFLDESRHLSNLKLATEFAECQIVAELLACAFTNYTHPLSKTMLHDQTIYAVRIIGTRFTFYKTQIKKEYFEALSQGGTLNESQSVSVLRYPPNDDKETIHGFDYSNKAQRPHILKLLTRLKEQIKK
jgi:hypothetical protein